MTWAHLRAALEGAVRGAWLVHSPDGVTPPPEPARRRTARRRRRAPPDARPGVRGLGEELEHDARGALVGSSRSSCASCTRC